MKKLLFLIPLIMFSCSKEKNEPTNYVVLIVGQSNTHAGIGYDSELDKTVDGIKQLGRFGNDNMKIIDATEPLHNHTASENKIGFGLTFSKLLKNYLKTEKNIILVPCGFGGTGFSQNNWNKGDELYSDAVARVKYVMENNPGSELTAMLWHQGESDVGSMSYENDLDNFINDIRNDLNAFDIPFILGGMVPFWVDKYDLRIKQQEIISNTVNRLNLIGYANPELPFRIEKQDNLFDEIHFDAVGQRELGKRYFSEYIRLISDN
ncbi:MAG: sialate O-acetylesterase [Gammaproteobacteria bacterium]